MLSSVSEDAGFRSFTRKSKPATFSNMLFDDFGFCIPMEYNFVCVFCFFLTIRNAKLMFVQCGLGVSYSRFDSM